MCCVGVTELGRGRVEQPPPGYSRGGRCGLANRITWICGAVVQWVFAPVTPEVLWNIVLFGQTQLDDIFSSLFTETVTWMQHVKMVYLLFVRA